MGALHHKAPVQSSARRSSTSTADDLKDETANARNRYSSNSGVQRTIRRTLIVISESESDQDEERTRVDEEHDESQHSNSKPIVSEGKQSDLSFPPSARFSLEKDPPSSQRKVSLTADSNLGCAHSEQRQFEKQKFISALEMRASFLKPTSSKADSKQSSHVLLETSPSRIQRELSPPVASTSRISTPVYVSSDASRHSSVTLVQSEDVPLKLKKMNEKNRRVPLNSEGASYDEEDDGIDQDDHCHQCKTRNIYAKMKCTKVTNARVCPLHYCHRCILIW